MKLFLDSAHLPEIEQFAQLGILSGITTNPTLMAHAGVVDIKTHIQKICTITSGPVSVETIGQTWQEMVEDGKQYATWSPHVVVKVPMGVEGIRATSELHKLGIPVNVTLIFSVRQAHLAMEAGASFISPFLGRLDDAGVESISLLHNIIQLTKLYGYSTEVIAASIRHALHVEQAALSGCHIATVPAKVLETLFDHPLTTKGISLFSQDAHSITS